MSCINSFSNAYWFQWADFRPNEQCMVTCKCQEVISNYFKDQAVWFFKDTQKNTTHTHTHSLSLSHTHTHSLSLSLTHTHTHTHTHTCTHCDYFIMTLTGAYFCQFTFPFYRTNLFFFLFRVWKKQQLIARGNEAGNWLVNCDLW